MVTPETSNLAVLVDADNAKASVIAEILGEVARYGTPTVKRASRSLGWRLLWKRMYRRIQSRYACSVRKL